MTPDDLAFQLRRSMSDAYAFARAQENTVSFSAITFEDLATEQRDRLIGKDDKTKTTIPSRPTALERVKSVESGLLSVLEQLQKTPSDVFLSPDPTKDVNTPVLQRLAIAHGAR